VVALWPVASNSLNITIFIISSAIACNVIGQGLTWTADYRVSIGLLLACRSRARLKRQRKSLVMMSSRSEFDAGADVPPSTIAQHYHHHHHHQMMSSSVPQSASSYPTLTSAVDTEFDVGYSSGCGNGCCVAASASFVDRHPLPPPVLDCACSDGRFRPRRAEDLDDARQRRECCQTKCSDHPDTSSFKDRLLRMPGAILFPVAESAVNYGLEDTGTTLRTVDVCHSCCTDSPIT